MCVRAKATRSLRDCWQAFLCFHVEQYAPHGYVSGLCPFTEIELIYPVTEASCAASILATNSRASGIDTE